MPDKTDVRGKLSPSILSFYNDESEDQIVPLPKLLEATGMTSTDRETILETVMELSGAKSTVNKAMMVRYFWSELLGPGTILLPLPCYYSD